MTKRLIIGNLDFEQTLLAETRGKTVMRYPQRVRQQISHSAALLAVFGRPGDTLWTEEALDTAAFEEPLKSAVEALDLRSGEEALRETLNERKPEEVLCWGMTHAIEDQLAPGPAGASVDGAGWLEAIWKHRPSANASARCNNRRFIEDTKRCQMESSTHFPFRRFIAEMSAFEPALVELVAQHPSGQWVAKPSYSAAGRKQIRGEGCELSSADRDRVSKHFNKYAGVMLESWVDRVADFGISGVIGSETVMLPVHHQHMHSNGGFVGISAMKINPTDDDEVALNRCAREVAAHLHKAGYRGAFTLDGYRYRKPDGVVALQPVGEINARISFGLVAQAWRARLGYDVLLEAAPPRILRLAKR
jgi:hypothetical protein